MTTTTRVAVLDDYQEVAASCADWGAAPDLEVTFFGDHLDDESVLADRLARFNVLVLMRERTPLPATLIARLPRLRLVVTTGARNAAIDVAAAARAGVVVCGTRSLITPAPELTWGLVLAALRDIPGQQERLRAGKWQDSVGTGLAGRTIGLIGLGNIGTRMARVAAAFDMNVLAWSANLTADRAASAGARLNGLDEMLASSDVVSIHLRLSERTRGLLGARQLHGMKPTAWLVNTSRAEIVDQNALLTALHEGWIAGAALDVYDREPLPADHPLHTAPRTVLTPHLGYVVRENYELFYIDALEAITAFLAGRPIRVIEPEP